MHTTQRVESNTETNTTKPELVI